MTATLKSTRPVTATPTSQSHSRPAGRGRGRRQEHGPHEEGGGDEVAHGLGREDRVVHELGRDGDAGAHREHGGEGAKDPEAACTAWLPR